MKGNIAIFIKRIPLKGLWRNLYRSVFLKNFFIVMSGTALAQTIGYLMSPIISRLFSAADFGVFGSFYAIVNIVIAVITLEYSQAIILPRAREDAYNILIVSILCTLMISFLLFIPISINKSAIYKLTGMESKLGIPLFLFIILANGINLTLQAWCIREKAFRQISLSQLIRSLSSNGFQVILGFLRAGSLGLVISTFIAEVLATLNYLYIFIYHLKNLKLKIDWRRVRALAKEYHDFPLYSATSNMINTLSQSLPAILLTRYYGLSVAGAYIFGLKIIGTPLGLISRPLRQVLFQKASETANEGKSLLNLFVKATSGLFLLGLIPMITVIAWGPALFSFIFGSKWTAAGHYARSLILWQMFMFCNIPSTLFGKILRIQKQLFFFDLSLLGARALVLVVGGHHWSASSTIFVFSIIGAIFNIAFIVIVALIINKKGRRDALVKEVINIIKED